MTETPLTRAAAAGINSGSSVLLVTIKKSGLNWFRFLFANYLNVVGKGPQADALTYRDLQDRCLPNQRQYIIDGRRQLKPAWSTIAQLTPFDDLLFQHVDSKSQNERFFLGRRLFAYRNPLDYLVSIYHYEYAQRPKKRHLAKGVGDVLEHELSRYCEQYLYARELMADPEMDFSYSYEELRGDTPATFSRILQWLGIPVDQSAVATACERSSFEAIRAHEVERGKPIVGPIEGFFTRDGRTGQWEEHLTKRQVKRAFKIMNDHGIDPETFALT